MNALTDAGAQSPNLDTGLLTHIAARESQNLAGLERELRAMRSPLPNGVMVSTPDFESLKRFAEANALRLEDIQNQVGVHEVSGRIILFKCEGKQISDPQALSGLTSLERLELAHNYIQDVSGLSGLTSLRLLDLGSNEVQDISPLSGLISLSDLKLYQNRIQDIPALTGLPALSRLFLGGNQLMDISGLRCLTSLKMLYLHENRIEDISVLSGLTLLKEIVLSENPIHDISALCTLSSLGRLKINRPKNLESSAAIRFDDQIVMLRSRNTEVDLVG